MRLFVAIKTNPAVNAAVKAAADGLSLFGSGSFCKADMYHITLAFIGETDRAEAIKAALAGIKDARPFEVCTGNLGSFGNTYFVSADGRRQLLHLQGEVCAALLTAGIKTEERAFKPHITVARRFSPRFSPAVFVPSAEMTVREIHLMESKDGAYRTVFTKPLNR